MRLLLPLTGLVWTATGNWRVWGHRHELGPSRFMLPAVRNKCQQSASQCLLFSP